MNQLNFSSKNLGNLNQNQAHNFAMNHSIMLFSQQALYTFIPKNGCSTFRLSAAINNGCISDISDGHWIHANNSTFKPTLEQSITAKYTFIIPRCPFRRLASVYLDKFVSKEPDAWQYRNTLERSIELDDLTFTEFVKSLSKQRRLVF